MSETTITAQRSPVSRAHALTTLAYILGVVALVGSIIVGGSYLRARAGVATAQKDGAKFEQEAADWQFGADLERQNRRMAAENDRLSVSNDNIEIGTAELEGRSTQRLREKLALDKAILRSDTLTLDSDATMEELGGEPHAEIAEQRVRACQASFAVWSPIKERDEHLGYALLGLWVAFGFAWALARSR